MGMYTGLRCKVIIKEEYREDIEIIVNNYNSDYEFRNKLKSELLKDFYFNISRATSIPHGNIEICKSTWGDDNKYGFQKFFDINTGLLKFECSLKNYDNTIEYFLDNILTKICNKSFHIEVLYSEWESSLLYEIKNNNLCELNNRIYYGWDYEPPTGSISYEEFDFS